MEAKTTANSSFDVQDILYHITQHLDPDRSSIDSEKVALVRRTLLSAALACKNFTRPALDALWRSLPSDMPLIYLLCTLGLARKHSFLDRNLPTSLEHNERASDNSLDPPAHPNWNRFREYAARVRNIRLKSKGDPFAAGLSIWAEISQLMPEEHILPLLHSVHLTGLDVSPLGTFSSAPTVFRLQSPDDFRFPPFDQIIQGARDRPVAALFLISPSVREIYFSFEGYTGDVRAPERALTEACARAPNLETITFSISPWGGNLAILHRNPHLRDISIGTPIGIQDLGPLTDLLNLKNLSIVLDSTREPRRDLLFPSLDRLSVTGSCDLLRDLLDRVQAPHLDKLVLYATQDGSAQLDHFHMCLQAAAAKFPGLQALSIYYSRLWRLSQAADPAASGSDNEQNTASLMALIAPLLSLHRLRHVVLCFGMFALRLSSDDVRALAEAWPVVESLDVDVASPGNGRAGVESLLHFARSCPRLRVLRLPVMDIAPGALEGLEYPAEPHPLQELDMDIEQVVFPPGMDLFREKTAFIQRVFPNVAAASVPPPIIF